MNRRRLIASVMLLVIAGCEGTGSAEPTSTTVASQASTTTVASQASTTTMASQASTTATADTSAGPTGTFSVNGHDLYIECLGSGEPTFVIESGEGAPMSELTPLRDALAERGMACLYDRGNVGQSGSTPTPRTAEDVASDLAALLEAAEVAGPYVFVGHSAGGMFVQLLPIQFPEETLAVVAMNPVPPYEEWFAQAVPLMDEATQASEADYYAGANGESLDYRTSSSQIVEAGDPPGGVPFLMLISTIAQCASPEDVCGITYPAYELIMKGVADSWPAGEFVQVEAGHLIPTSDVVAEVDRMLEAMGG